MEGPRRGAAAEAPGVGGVVTTRIRRGLLRAVAAVRLVVPMRVRRRRRVVRARARGRVDLSVVVPERDAVFVDAVESAVVHVADDVSHAHRREVGAAVLALLHLLPALALGHLLLELGGVPALALGGSREALGVGAPVDVAQPALGTGPLLLVKHEPGGGVRGRGRGVVAEGTAAAGPGGIVRGPEVVGANRSGVRGVVRLTLGEVLVVLRLALAREAVAGHLLGLGARAPIAGVAGRARGGHHRGRAARGRVRPAAAREERLALGDVHALLSPRGEGRANAPRTNDAARPRDRVEAAGSRPGCLAPGWGGPRESARPGEGRRRARRGGNVAATRGEARGEGGTAVRSRVARCGVVTRRAVQTRLVRDFALTECLTATRRPACRYLFLGTAVKISASARRAPPHPARTQSPEARVHAPSARVHAPSARVPPSPHAVAATRRDGVVRRGAASSRVPAAPARVGTRGRRRRRPVIPDVALVVHARRVRGLVGIRVGRVRGLGGGGRRGLVAPG